MSYERDQDPMDRPPLPPEPDEFRRGRRGRDGGRDGGAGDGGGKPRSRALPIFIALFAVGAFGGIVWYAYTQGVQSGVSTVAPVIKADDGPTKARPEQPGGLQVPHQDKQVFQRLLPEGQAPQTVERLLPPPPEPLQPPPAPEPTPSAAAPAQPQPLPSQSVAERPVATPQPAPQAVPQDTPPVPSAAPAPQPPQDAPAKAPANAPAQAQQAAQPPAPQPAPTPAPAPQPAAEPKPAPTPAQTQQASIAAVSGGGFKVQLAAVRSDEAAKQEWNRLKNRYKEELGALSLTVQRVDLGAGKGIYHRIQAGPLDEAAAERACTALKAKNQACLVVRP